MAKSKHVVVGLIVAAALGCLVLPTLGLADHRDKLEAIEREIDTIPNLGAHEITLDYYNGSVTLTGTVASTAARHEVEMASRRVPGINMVTNRLEVVNTGYSSEPRARMEPREVSSAEAQRGIEGALKNIREFNASGVNVNVTNGVATLTGELSNFQQVDRVLATTLNVEGVNDVRSEITVAGRAYQPDRFVR